ncbi:MAG: S1 RNA-binding domain-containing protein, partial [Clostridiales bacterium]|nr:S1 RNA-binding domain-containing protein [Clostridiales bacterium]
PIKRPVAGISSGLITDPDNDDNFLVLIDIQGIEDFFGDMDFKVAGTTEGITSIQVDIKVEGLSLDIIKAAFEMTHKGRLQIINDIILPRISEPRAELSKYAPRIISMQIPVDKIREVIGSGGKVINKIIADTGADININDDGQLYISIPDLEAAAKAQQIINGIIADPEVGQEFDGVVTRLMDFGAFVEFLPGKEGLVHISKLAWNRVEKVEDVLHEGDKVRVKLIEIDSQGRLNLSIRDTLPKPEGYVEEEPRKRENRPNRERRGGFNGNRERRHNNDSDDDSNRKGRRIEF